MSKSKKKKPEPKEIVESRIGEQFIADISHFTCGESEWFATPLGVAWSPNSSESAALWGRDVLAKVLTYMGTSDVLAFRITSIGTPYIEFIQLTEQDWETGKIWDLK